MIQLMLVQNSLKIKFFTVNNQESQCPEKSCGRRPYQVIFSLELSQTLQPLHNNS